MKKILIGTLLLFPYFANGKVNAVWESPSQNKDFWQYQQSKQAFKQGDFSQSVEKFQALLSQYPKANPLRIELARAYFYNKQYHQAESLFLQALEAKDLPPRIAKIIQYYLKLIKNNEDWQWDFSLRYARENNLTGIAEYCESCRYSYGEREAGEGFGYWGMLSKKKNLFKNYFLTWQNQIYGASYWDNHSFDEMTTHTSLSLSYQDAKNNIGLVPFYQRYWFGDHRYSWDSGIKLQFSHRLNSQFSIYTSGEWYKKHYFNYWRKKQNSNNQILSLNLTWQPTKTQYFYTSTSWQKTRANKQDFSYDSYSLTLGWQQYWTKGLYSQLSSSLSYRRDKENTYFICSFMGLRCPIGIRKDHRYSANLSLWNRNWHLFGIQPKVNFRWEKQKSNLPSLYSYQEKSIGLTLEKAF